MKFRKHIRLVSWGGIGDALLTTPALAAIKLTWPDSHLTVFCPPNHRDVYLNNPHIDSLKTPGPVARAVLNFAKTSDTNYFEYWPSVIYPHKHATELIAERLGVMLARRELAVYLTDKEEQEAAAILRSYVRPITIHTTSNSCSNQRWPIEYWEQLVAEMPDCTFVQLGLEHEPPVKGAVDQRGKTSLRISMALIKRSLVFVGVVSSLAHASNAVRTPAVLFCGPSSASNWGHSNAVHLDKRLPCAPCVELLRDWECPYDRACMKNISVQEAKEAIRHQLAASTDAGGLQRGRSPAMYERAFVRQTGS